jgi:phage gpG-like protein
MENPLQLPLFKLGRLIVRLKPQLIDALGVEALKFIDDNFRMQGFQGTTLEPWPQRKGKDKGKARKILVLTGTLRRSFVQHNSADHTTISTDVPYAQVHNEGGVITRGTRTAILSHREKNGRRVFAKAKQATSQVKATTYAHSFKMPKRQFIGNSPVLTNHAITALTNIITRNLNQIT